MSEFLNKKCGTCKKTLHKSAFYASQARGDGLNSACKPCVKEKNEARAADNSRIKRPDLYYAEHKEKKLERHKQRIAEIKAIRESETKELVSKIKSDLCGVVKGYFWSSQEDTVLFKYYSVVKTSVLARALERSAATINQRAHEIGVRKHRLNGYEKSLKRRFDKIKNSALERTLEFNLVYEETKSLLTGRCHFCGHIPSPAFNGLDRLNPNEGYVKDNVVSCCKTCNIAKSTLTAHEYIEHCRKVLTFRSLNGG